MDSTRTLWPRVQGFMKRESGVVLDDEQHYLLEVRLSPLVRQFALGSLAELVDKVCNADASTPLARAMVDAFTTHESFFFRDANFWRAFEEFVMPQLIANSRCRRLRFWSAACSHGQEPYSLAMLLEEKWPDVARTTEILATDVSPLAVERAKEGLYSSLEVNRGLSAARLMRHFEQDRGSFRVKPVLRDRITWSVHNLLGSNRDPSHCDVVLCRNVLIYFSEADRKATLARIEMATRDNGFIALGGTETSPRMQIAPGVYERHSEQLGGTP